ncbi:MAG: hypothetical protein F3742_00500 [Nitrospinae bacterium]|nr:hypothetical protein [Nitrospinota bacterium]
MTFRKKTTIFSCFCTRFFAGAVILFSKEILPIFNKGLEHYRNRRWEEGIQCFEQVLAKKDDGPSLTYFERCITFQAQPPPDDWDGVLGMTTK